MLTGPFVSTAGDRKQVEASIPHISWPRIADGLQSFDANSLVPGSICNSGTEGANCGLYMSCSSSLSAVLGSVVLSDQVHKCLETHQSISGNLVSKD
jgi:hypothetical protein